MNNNNTRRLVLYGLMIAMVFVTTYFTRIPGPLPEGYINFGDILIMVSAILLGKNGGFVAGAIGSAMADLILGYPVFAPVTFVVKGLEGYITGAIANNSKENGSASYKRIVAAVTIGAAVMVFGYFIAEFSILRLFSTEFGLAAALTELPGNLIQGGVSAVVGYIIVGLLNRVNIRKYIFH